MPASQAGFLMVLAARAALVEGLGEFQRGDRGFVGHGGKVVNKLAQGLPALEVVQ